MDQVQQIYQEKSLCLPKNSQVTKISDPEGHKIDVTRDDGRLALGRLGARCEHIQILNSQGRGFFGCFTTNPFSPTHFDIDNNDAHLSSRANRLAAERGFTNSLVYVWQK